MGPAEAGTPGLAREALSGERLAHKLHMHVTFSLPLYMCFGGWRPPCPCLFAVPDAASIRILLFLVPSPL